MPTSILVVDASREFGILIRQSLEEKGEYRATVVHRGQQALELAASQTFELALIDFGLPDIPGSELVRQLQQIKPDLSIIAIPMAGSSEELEGLKVSGVLTKPFYLPDLPRTLKKALSQQSFQRNWIQWEQPEEKQKAQISAPPTQPEELAEDKPGRADNLRESDTEATLPAGLMERGTEGIAAIGSLLWNGTRVVDHAGLSRSQLTSLTSTLAGMGSQIQSKRAVTQYIQIPDQADDLLLFASPWRKDLTLVTLYPAKTAFSQVRKGNQELAHFLKSQTMAGRKTEPSKPAESDQPTPIRQSEDQLPDDWVPEDELSPSQRAMLDELASIDPPPADPLPSPEQASKRQTPAKLPPDWIPSDHKSSAVLAMLEETTEPTHIANEATGGTGAGGRLSYYLILLPRFPEHHFERFLAKKIEAWVQRICLAWDWRAQRVSVTKVFLQIQIQLNTESAPAEAAHQLKTDLSRRILSERPEWGSSLPSDRFFTKKHLLTAGTPPSEEEVRQFIQQTRRAQGFTS